MTSETSETQKKKEVEAFEVFHRVLLSFNDGPFIFCMWLLNGHALSKVARLVNIGAAKLCDVIRENL